MSANHARGDPLSPMEYLTEIMAAGPGALEAQLGQRSFENLAKAP